MKELMKKVSPEVAANAIMKSMQMHGELLRDRRVALYATPAEVCDGTTIDPQILMQAERTGQGIEDIYEQINFALDHMEALKLNETY